MNIGYIRVSSAEQNTDTQKFIIEKYNIEKVFEEKISGKDMNRPQLQLMLDFVREGDTVFIYDFSRLARSTKDLLHIVEQLQQKNVHLVSDKEQLDTNTATGKLMLTMIGAINEFQREIQREKQAEGIFIAKQKGKYKGRKKIDFPKYWEEVYNQYMTRKLTAAQAMNVLGLKKNTFYNLKRRYEEEKGLK